MYFTLKKMHIEFKHILVIIPAIFFIKIDLVGLQENIFLDISTFPYHFHLLMGVPSFSFSLASPGASRDTEDGGGDFFSFLPFLLFKRRRISIYAWPGV